MRLLHDDIFIMNYIDILINNIYAETTRVERANSSPIYNMYRVYGSHHFICIYI